MGRLSRYTQYIFGSNAGNDQLMEFGSLSAGNPVYYSGSSVTPSAVQTLSNYLVGWFAAVVGSNSPTIQEMNALFYLVTYQLAQGFQDGIPQWDSGTTYYTGSIAQDGNGNTYVSKVDNNQNHPLTNLLYWKPFQPGALNPQVNKTVATRNVSQWTAENASSAAAWYSICWSPELGLFCAGVSATGTLMTSPDGINWTARTASLGATGLCWSPELALFIAVDRGGGIMTSPDGASWTTRTSPSTEQWWSVCWSPELGKLVACANIGGAGTNQFMYSSDGITWTGVPVAGGQWWQSVCWSSELGLFVAVAWPNTGGVTSLIATSQDGATWTVRTAPASKQWGAVVWSKGLGLFAAVSFDGAVMTSQDGINWTLQTPVGTSNQWNGIDWSPQLGAFVAVAQTGQIMYSFDGITWVSATAPAANKWSGIVWSPEKGIFASVSQTGTNRVMISKHVKKFAC